MYPPVHTVNRLGGLRSSRPVEVSPHPAIFISRLCFVYLLYVDESGNPDGAEDKYFVLGGIATEEVRPYWLSEDVNALEQKYFPGGEKVEFHAQTITAYAEEPWHSMDSKKRTAVLEDLCRIISDTGPKVTLFGVALDKVTNQEPVARAFEEICYRFDIFLKRVNAQGKTERGLIIFDKSRYETRLQTLLSHYRNTGARFGKVRNFADVPFFADSKSTRLLQLADLVAYAIFRRYERSQTWLLDKLINKFDTQDGIIHGLVHLSRDHLTCMCPSCLSRRMAQGTVE
jgi:hypothetical protein